jgi:hypothetical protein
MEDHQAGLAQHASVLLDRLDTAGVDYQIGVTTTQSRPCEHDPTAFLDCEDANGTAGRLRGLANEGNDTSQPPTLVAAGSPTAAADLAALLQVGIDGATEEYGLFVAAQAVCASLALPYATDFVDWQTDDVFTCSGASWDSADPWYDFCHCLPQGWEEYNTSAQGVPLLRSGKALLVVFVTDEGDHTPNAGSPEPWPWDDSGCQLGAPWPAPVQSICAPDPAAICANECKIDHFMQFFDSLERPVRFVTLGPDATFDASYNVVWECNDLPSSYPMVEWYLFSAELTGAPYLPLQHWTGDCFTDPDYPDMLTQIGDFAVSLVP